MMVSSDFRKEARTKLTGKWGKAVCIVLAYMLISFAIGFVQGLLPETGIIALIVSIAVYAIEIPLSFGMVFAFFKLFYGEDVKAFSFWSLGFNNFSRAWGVAFRTALKLIVPFILIIVSYILMAFSISMAATSALLSAIGNSSSSTGSAFLMIISVVLLIASTIWMTVKSYYYSLAQYVAFDNPDLTPNECVLKSKELMTNRRGKLFCLQFSFIGWAILAAFTFGIGYLWLLPYIQMSTIAFYDKLAHEENVEA